MGGSPEELDYPSLDSSANSPLVEKTKKRPWYSRLVIIEPALFIFGVAYFSFTQLNQEYLYDRILGDVITNVYENFTLKKDEFTEVSVLKNVTDDFEVSAKEISTKASSVAALISTGMAFARCGPPCLTSLLICSGTDILGRKIGLIVPALGGLFRAVVYWIVDAFHLHLGWLYVGEVLDGLGGENLAFLGCAYAYLSDTEEGGSLTFRFTVANCVFLSASAVANLAIGFVVSELGFQAAIVFVGCCYAVSALYIAVLLPNTGIKYGEKEFSVAAILRNSVDSFKIFSQPRPNRDQTVLLLLFLGATVISFANLNFFDLETVFLQGYPFHMDPAQIGMILAISSFLWMFVPPPFLKALRLCISEEMSLAVMAAFCGLTFVIQGFSDLPIEILVANCLASFGTGILPASSALLTKITEPSERGAVQACFSSVSSVGSLMSKTSFVALYGATVSFYYGTAHLVIGGIQTICVGLFMAAWYLRKPQSYEPLL